MSAAAPLLIGLTGGIGSGKSTVADLFAEQGARIIDTDVLSHQLTAPSGAAMTLIGQEFGEQFIQADGALDRAKMRLHIFAEACEKKKLEAILHPLILALTKQAIAVPSGAPYTLLVVPLLFEGKNYQAWLARSLVVDCQESSQIQRTMRRSGLPEAAVRSIVAQQISRAERLRLADDVITNDADLSALAHQVARLHQSYLALSVGND